MNNYIRVFKIKKINHTTINYKIAQAAILLALSFVISYFSLYITKSFGFVYGVDCSYFLMIASLYIVGYKFSFIISILHGLITIFISGSWVGGFANMTESVLLISTWLIISSVFLTNNNAESHPIWSVVKIIITIILVSLIAAVLMTLANLYVFYPLVGLYHIIKQPLILWSHFVSSNVINVINIILFLALMPIFQNILKNIHH